MRIRNVWATLLATMALLAIGCGKPYSIDQPLEERLTKPSTVKVGSFVDQLPIGTPEDKKPTIDDITRFREVIENRLEETKLFHVADTNQTYEVRGAILEYKRGSGFLRFLFGAMAGSAKIYTHLELVDTRTNRAVFGGTFSGAVVSWQESGAAMYDRVAKDFAKQLKKQSEEITLGGSS